jgi:hypothetical protein
MIKVLNYLREQYLAVIITVILIFFTFSEQQKNNVLLKQVVELEGKILVLEEKDHEAAKVIDSLSKVDTLIVNRIKTIKEKEYVQIRIIDSLPVSELQKYFTDRYSEK